MPLRRAPGVRAVAEPSQASAPWIVKQFGQDVPDGQVERMLRILPQRQVRVSRGGLEGEPYGHSSSALISTS